MGKYPWLVVILAVVTPGALAQKKQSTTPANETTTPSAIRSPHSKNGDLAVPLCPARFHDSLGGNGIAGRHEQGVTPPRIKSTVPALITQDAIQASDRSHVGNYVVLVNVVVGVRGHPTKLCLEKSSGYGLDAAAAAAVQAYRFDPANKNGKAVAMRTPVHGRFTTETPPESSHSLPPR